MRYCIAVALSALLLCALPPRGVEAAKKTATVDCVYPGEVLRNALNDLATQTGYTFVPGKLAKQPELDEQIWVYAKDVTPEMAARMIGASGGMRVALDSANREVTVAEINDEDTGKPHLKSFDVDALCKQYIAYEKRYGRKGEGGDKDVVYHPTAAEELRDAVDDVLHLENSEDIHASVVGKRLLYTRDEAVLAHVGELLKLLEAKGGGESAALQLDRKNCAALMKMHGRYTPEDGLISSLLYHLFKDGKIPVYIDRSLMQQFDLRYATTDVVIDDKASHYDALQSLAREWDFLVDSADGALRLHEEDFEGAISYRVFDVDDLLAALEKDYADLKTDDDVFEGFHGDLRSQGGVRVIVEALEQQLNNAGFSPLVRAYGGRVVVTGGVDVIGKSSAVLEAMGWQGDADKQKGEQK